MKCSPCLDNTDACWFMNDPENGVVGFPLTSMILAEVTEWTCFTKFTQEYTWVEFFVGF